MKKNRPTIKSLTDEIRTLEVRNQLLEDDLHVQIAINIAIVVAGVFLFMVY